jgi:hypothetical protein
MDGHTYTYAHTYAHTDTHTHTLLRTTQLCYDIKESHNNSYAEHLHIPQSDNVRPIPPPSLLP